MVKKLFAMWETQFGIPMDKGAWQAIGYGIIKSRTQLRVRQDWHLDRKSFLAFRDQMDRVLV